MKGFGAAIPIIAGAIIVLMIAATGCQYQPKSMSDADVEQMADAIVDDLADAMMEHPTMQTTPEEDCFAVVFMATVVADSGFPTEAEIDEYCDWYIKRLSAN